MNTVTRMILVGTTLISALVAQAPKIKPGGTGEVKCGPTRKAGTDSIEFGVRSADGTQVYKYGGDVSLAQGISAATKAEKIKEMVENHPDLKDLVHVALAPGSHALNFTAKSPYTGLPYLKFVNNTTQKGNTFGVIYPSPLSDTGPFWEYHIGRVIMIGGTCAGVDGYNVQSDIEVGTNTYVCVYQPYFGESLSNIIAWIVDDLVANGVDASLENAASIKIVLEDSADKLHFGNTDSSVHQAASIENSLTN